MKICILSTLHPPSDPRIFRKEAQSLGKKYSILLIAPSNKSEEVKSGKISLSLVKKPGRNILHFITFFRIFRVAMRNDYDVIHCHEPDSLLIGVFLKKIKGCKLVYDVHEHWPTELPFDLGLKPGSVLFKMAGMLVSGVEMFCSRRADQIIAVSESVAERFLENELEPVIIANFPLEWDQEFPFTREKPDNLLYVAGNMHFFHGINRCVAALDMLSEHYPEISLTLIGKLRETLADVIPQTGLRERIRCTGFLAPEEMYGELRHGGIGLLLFQPSYYNIFIGLPNKLFDYMLCGLPVIASDFPEIKKIVENAECGILVDPENVDEIITAVRYLLDHPEEAERMGKNGQKAVREKYNWGEMEKRLFSLYKELGEEIK
jgi:glycosyltransferase involved in cell wall biosynthesis